MHTKIFIGTRLTPDLKARLYSFEGQIFKFVPFDGKEYLGSYVDSTFPTLCEIKNLSHELMETLQKYLPDMRTDTLPLVVFPQLFLG